MKKDDSAFATPDTDFSFGKEGLTKYEYTCIEFMKALMVENGVHKDFNYTDLAQRAKKAADELFKVLCHHD